jgi:quinol monooxygenase YgiN
VPSLGSLDQGFHGRERAAGPLDCGHVLLQPAGPSSRWVAEVMAGVVVVGDLHALVGRRDALLELLVDTQARARQEPGCISYTFAEVVGEPGHVLICEEWADAAAVEQHYGSSEFGRYQRQVGEFLASPSEVRFHHVRETLLPQDGAPMDPRRAD